jgi:hypothetical protein
MNILILGHARHGKDTVAELIARFTSLYFTSSTQIYNEEFVFDAFSDKYGYETKIACFNDRVNHREEWYNLIKDYNSPDLTAGTRLIFDHSDIQVGIRDKDELEASITAGLYDLILGVHNPNLPYESKSSFNIDVLRYAEEMIWNNGDLEELEEKVRYFCKHILGEYE